MAERQCCGNCRFWWKYANTDDKDSSYPCRRFPPTTDQGKRWPHMRSDFWCGEWANIGDGSGQYPTAFDPEVTDALKPPVVNDPQWIPDTKE